VQIFERCNHLVQEEIKEFKPFSKNDEKKKSNIFFTKKNQKLEENQPIRSEK
jgi:hypothetical protein